MSKNAERAEFAPLLDEQGRGRILSQAVVTALAVANVVAMSAWIALLSYVLFRVVPWLVS